MCHKYIEYNTTILERQVVNDGDDFSKKLVKFVMFMVFYENWLLNISPGLVIICVPQLKVSLFLSLMIGSATFTKMIMRSITEGINNKTIKKKSKEINNYLRRSITIVW